MQPRLIAHTPKKARTVGQKSLPPILLVPGAFSGAWVYEDTFLPALAERGLEAHALTFRSHLLGDPARDRLGLGDYVADLAAAIDAIGRPPVVIAHSMGALITVRYLTRHRLPGAVLLAPLPPDGARATIRRLLLSAPFDAGKMMGLALYAPVRLLAPPPRGIYSDRLPPARTRALTKRLRGESRRAMVQLLTAGPTDLARIDTPLRVIGAEGDRLIAPVDVRRAGRLLGTEPLIYPGMSHHPMLEPEWPQVLDDIVAWIDTISAEKDTVA